MNGNIDVQTKGETEKKKNRRKTEQYVRATISESKRNI